MDDSAVVPGLMASELRFFLEEDDPDGRPALYECQSGCEPDDAPADDGDIMALRTLRRQ